MQRDVMDMKDEVREMKNEHALYTKGLRKKLHTCEYNGTSKSTP